MKRNDTEERAEVKYVMIVMSTLAVLTSFYKAITGVDILSPFVGLVVCLICYGVYKKSGFAIIFFLIYSIGVTLMGVLAVYMMIRWSNRDNAELRFSRPDLYIIEIAHTVFHLALTVIYLRQETERRRLNRRQRRQRDGSSVLAKPEKGDDIPPNSEMSK